MASSKISGSVKKVGSRVTHLNGNTRVEEIVEIDLKPTDEQKKAFEKDPTDLIKQLLTQEGHTFREVKGVEIGKPVSHLRGAWFHIVYDAGNPGLVCAWQYFHY
jgi:hypothetical protein